MVADYKTSTFKQRGKAGKEYKYEVEMSAAGDLILAVDQGTPRGRPKECGNQDVFYNIYL